MMSYNPYTNKFYPNVVLKVVHFNVTTIYIINNNITTNAREIFYVFMNNSTENGIWMKTPELKVGYYLYNPIMRKKVCRYKCNSKNEFLFV